MTQNYYLKLIDPSYNIWKNDSTLQFQAEKVRLIKPFRHPVGREEYETVENSLMVEIDLPELEKDSDHDGITDIVEEKLMLNPHQADTDGDGVADSEDHNPRFKSEHSDENILFKAMLDPYLIVSGDEFRIHDGKIMNPKWPTKVHELGSMTHFIVTDIEALQHVPLDYNQIIFVTSNEFKNYIKQYPMPPNTVTVSPKLKIDNVSNGFFFLVDYHIGEFGPRSYIIQRTDDGFTLRTGGWERGR